MRANEISFFIMPLPPRPQGGACGPLAGRYVHGKEEASSPVSALIRGKSLNQAIEWINITTAQSRITSMKMFVDEKTVITYWT